MRSARVWQTAGHAAQATHSPGRILSRHEADTVFKRETSERSRGWDRRGFAGPGGAPDYHSIRLAFQRRPGVVRTAVRKRSA
jgi:hypothetical protein